MKWIVITGMLGAGAAAAAEDPHAHHRMDASPALPAAEPPVPREFAADRIFGVQAMSAARDHLRHEHGAHVISQVMVNELEYARARGEGGYHWDAEAWIGGDLNRAVLKTKGEGESQVDHAEIQALYSRAIGPYFDLQAGLRHEFEPGPSRTSAVLGVEGLAPYWFEVEAAAFLSDQGDVLARAEASYEQLVTQKLVLQPQAEVNFAAQRIDSRGLASGFTALELGLRLRYEIRREFAPYVGVSYARKIAGTADLARSAGEPVAETVVVVGLRAWF